MPRRLAGVDGAVFTSSLPKWKSLPQGTLGWSLGCCTRTYRP